MTQTAEFIQGSGADLVVPHDPALTLAPDLWADVRAGVWAFGNDPFPRDVVRRDHYMLPVGANAIFKTGMLGRGFSNASPTVTTSYWKYAKLGGGDETGLMVRQLNAAAAAHGFTIEILFEPDTTTSQSLFTTSQNFTVYAGMDITMTTAMFVNLGDGTGELSSDRVSSLSASAIEAGKVNYWAWSAPLFTDETNWRQICNRQQTVGQNGAGGTGSGGVVYPGGSNFNNAALCVLGRDFITNNFTGKLYGFNILHKYLTPNEMLDRNDRILDMFRLATTRETAPTGFINLPGIGPAPQAQSLS